MGLFYLESPALYLSDYVAGTGTKLFSDFMSESAMVASDFTTSSVSAHNTTIRVHITSSIQGLSDYILGYAVPDRIAANNVIQRVWVGDEIGDAVLVN